ncbi:MAG: hypothetical protein WC455_29525 [Dehalococcoidia bacterium]
MEQQLSRSDRKLQEAKRKVDEMTGLPGVMLRKGVVHAGDALTGYTDFNFKLLRDMTDRTWLFFCEWVDPDGEGHRVVLPHAVVDGVLQRAASIMAQARKERAQHGADTRRRRRQTEPEA